MIIEPKIRGFVCVTAHPEGCAKHVEEQIAHVQQQGTIANGPKNVLVIGASTGYGLASRIVAAFGSQAKTLGIFFERPATNGKPASAGWYNSVAFEKYAHNAGLWAKSLNGDAFSNELKAEAIRVIQESMGKIDLVVYSLASPRRTDPYNGTTYKSVLKPIGSSFTGKTVDTDKKLVTDVTIEPASQQECDETVKVMGGEDWKWWIEALLKADVLANNVQTVAYSYVGPKVTWPIYTNGTIGQAKVDLDHTAQLLTHLLSSKNGHAWVSVNKAVVTQASSAIPVVPLYISILFKIMKAKGLHEDCIQQIYRLAKQLSKNTPLNLDNQNRIRIDDLEMRPDVQAEVATIWEQINTDNLSALSDFQGYQTNFLKLFGFGLPNVNYSADTPSHVLESQLY
ncbi:MAG TPA: bifunctional NADH-specific enoyl-ACP reductase/trans-2-enoyl-CoA reductase [Opitutae bacterium]|nr:bifunctional NADH-specific enoyl-ACP reductase/trans-2-enoyl-CoA reductase [Opitutae bacterium]